MKTLNVTDVARNFNSVMAEVESGHEEVLLVRNRKPIARLVPEPEPSKAPTLSRRESELWATINRTLSSTARADYRTLRKKAELGTLNTAEHKHLLALTDEIEGALKKALEAFLARRASKS